MVSRVVVVYLLKCSLTELNLMIFLTVSGVVRPGEFLAIMGASGAGKSTLLNTLLFRNLSGLKVSGLRLANNKLVTPTSLTAVSAYVQQDDLFIGTLTVREHLTFQALVRMDRDIPDKTRMVKVNEIIQEVRAEGRVPVVELLFLVRIIEMLRHGDWETGPGSEGNIWRSEEEAVAGQ